MELKLKVYTRRQGHDDTYTITQNAKGWLVSNGNAHRGQSDNTGAPVLYSAFGQDLVSYPVNIGDYLESLWDHIQSKKVRQDEAQEYMDLVSQWLEATEKSKPKYPGDYFGDR